MAEQYEHEWGVGRMAEGAGPPTRRCQRCHTRSDAAKTECPVRLREELDKLTAETIKVILRVFSPDGYDKIPFIKRLRAAMPSGLNNLARVKPYADDLKAGKTAEVTIHASKRAELEADLWRLGVEVNDPELPQREPVSADRVVNALMAKPGLAWEVVAAIREEAMLLGPWEQLSQYPDEEDDGVPWTDSWARRSPTGDANLVVFQIAVKETWHVLKFGDVFMPSQEVGGSTADVDLVLGTVDNMLLSAGYVLA